MNRKNRWEDYDEEWGDDEEVEDDEQWEDDEEWDDDKDGTRESGRKMNPRNTKKGRAMGYET